MSRKRLLNAGAYYDITPPVYKHTRYNNGVIFRFFVKPPTFTTCIETFFICIEEETYLISNIINY